MTTKTVMAKINRSALGTRSARAARSKAMPARRSRWSTRRPPRTSPRGCAS